MPRLELCFLGPFQVTLEGVPVTTFESNKVRALLACLATEAPRPQPRERLAALLWPDWPQQSAMSNLRYALADLRKNIGDRQVSPPYLLISRESIQLNPEADIRVDVLEFEQGIGGREQGIRTRAQGPRTKDSQSSIPNQQSAILTQQSAISLYRGPFLEGFSLADSAPFEEWLLAKRGYFNRQMLEALQRLVDHFEQSGEYEPAKGYVQRQLDLEPWREEAHQQLMRLLALSGQRSAALAQFDRCRQALRDGLGVAPGAETTALYERIRDGNLAPAQPAGAVAETVSAPASIPSEVADIQSLLPRHNLPRQLTRFIGREVQVAQALELVRQNALVTLTGPGGVGKTRLGLAVAEELMDEFKDGVWLIELAPLTDPDRLPQILISTLGVLEDPARTFLETLSHYFRGRETLLVLDNCEHLVEACAGLAQALLGAAPSLKMLTTSREALGVPGEMAVRVPSLLFPPPGQALETDRLEQYETVRLFLDRARAVVTDYQLTPTNATAVAQICQRLDGIPLAIELAAARVASLEAAQIAARLEQAFRLLAGGSRAALERHRTLRATVDWSYNLLSAPERILLQRLSVFAGGWTLEAAEGVCEGEGVDEAEVLDLLSQLVNKSMILVDRSIESGLRYRMLETIRQYTVEKLFETGESEHLRARHLAYFVAFAERIEDGLRGPELVERLNRLEAELDNFRLALEWGLQMDALPELRLASALMWFWHIHSSHRNEGLAWLQQGLALEAASCDRQETRTEVSMDTNRACVRAKALSAAGFHLMMQDKVAQSIAILEESLALFRRLEGDHRWWIAFNYSTMGSCYFPQEPARIFPFIEQSRALFEEIGDPMWSGANFFFDGINEPDPQLARQINLDNLVLQKERGDVDWIATAAQQLGWSTSRLGNYVEAVQWLQESLAGYRLVGNSWSVANQLHWLGNNTWYLGDSLQALQYYKDAAAIYREVGAHSDYAMCILQQSLVSLSAGLYPQTEQILKTALELGRELSDWRFLAEVYFNQMRMDWQNEDGLQAAQRLEKVLAIIGDEATTGFYRDLHYFSGRLALWRGDLPQALTDFKAGLQISLKINNQFHIAFFLSDLASLSVRCGDMERAARLFGAVEGLFPGMVNTLSPIERGWREQDIQAARLALGKERYQAEFDQGRGMTMEQAAAYVLEKNNATFRGAS